MTEVRWSGCAVSRVPAGAVHGTLDKRRSHRRTSDVGLRRSLHCTPHSALDRRFVRRAIALAERHSRDGRHGPFGAVVVRRDGVVVGEGWNRVVAGRDPTAHAEVVAIRAACRRLRTHILAGCTIYCSCEPCPMCLAAIYWARVQRVVFACARRDAGRAGFDDERLYREIPRPWRARSLAWRQLDRARGLRVLESWLRNSRRREY